MIGFGIYANAQSGSCKVPGTNDYVQANLNGFDLTVVNGSQKPLATVHVDIYADVENTDGNGNRTGTYERHQIIFSSDFYSFAPYGNQVIRSAIACTSCKNYDIRVSNPICKSE